MTRHWTGRVKPRSKAKGRKDQEPNCRPVAISWCLNLVTATPIETAATRKKTAEAARLFLRLEVRLTVSVSVISCQSQGPTSVSQVIL